MKKKKFGIVKLLFLCGIVGIISAIPTLSLANKPAQPIEGSAYTGILTIWNVDTFEGGSVSKSSFLESCAIKFSKSHKGVYFLVKNLTPDEMLHNFNSEIYPDIISFGWGLGADVQSKLLDISSLNLSGVRSELLESGKSLAVPFLMGGMILASTEEKLMNAGISSSNTLLNLVNSAGFDKSSKRGTTHISSVVVGDNKYVNLLDNFESVSGGSELTDVHKSPSGYDAYADFVSYNAGTILLGTHRDLFKLSGRVAVGKLSGVKIEYLSGFTNLIQYVGIMNSLTGDTLEIAKSYLEFLVSEDAQKMTTQIGMVNTIGKTYYEEGEFMTLEETLNGVIKVPSVF